MAALTAVLAMAMLALASAQSTKGTRFEGFTYASDVRGYVNMTLDYCDIQAAISDGNFTAAQEIYQLGKNSFSGAVKRTFYRFASHVPTAAEPLYDMLTLGRNGTWLDDLINGAFAAQNGPLALGLINVAVIKYFVHEVDEAYNKIAAYVADPANLTINIDDDRGAPHNVDEAFSLWAGGNPAHCGTLSSMTAALGKDLDTSFVGSTYLNLYATSLLNEFLAASRAGDLDTFKATRDSLVRALNLLGIQGVLQAAYKTQLATKCKRPAADIAAAKASLSAHWTYLRPLLVSRRPSAGYAARWAEHVRRLETALSSSTPDFKKAWDAAKLVLSGMGRRTTEVGYPNFATINADWKCPSSARP